MALITCVRETRRYVVGIRRAVEIGHVAGRARSVLGKVIRPTHERRAVALTALQGDVRAGEGESRGGVIEGSARPIGCAVTGLASSRESSLHVIWIRCAGVVSLVTGQARGGRREVIRAALERRGMALGALQRGVRSVQGKAGTRMVKGRTTPIGRVVALRTILREIRLHVIRIRRAGEVRLVTGVAGGAGRQV